VLDLAISNDMDLTGTTAIETNHGVILKTDEWPRDCDFQLVVFSPSGKRCDVVRPYDLAKDIARAITILDEVSDLGDRKPGWYQRLKRCAEGALT